MKQNGAALIPALLVVAITAGLAAGLASRLDANLQAAIYRRDEIAATELARAAIDYCSSVLWDDARTTGPVDSLNEIWAARVGALPVEGGKVGGVIRDAQALFNVNNLLVDGKPSEADIAALDRLARSIGVTQDVGSTLAGLLQQHPARSVVHIDELTSLPALATLQPYLVALPERTPINVNTAAAEVIAAYLPGVGPGAILDTVGSASSRKVFATSHEFAKLLPQLPAAEIVSRFAVGSHYFLVQGVASQGRASIRAEALVQRKGRWPQAVYVKMTSS